MTPANLTIRPCGPNADDAYASLITAAIAADFSANFETSSQLIDALTSAFVATAQTRQGPAPTPESLVELRRIFGVWTARAEPIPVLVPWGSCKPAGFYPDIADLAALKQLIALQDRVKQVYPFGIHVNIQIEDLGGMYLWHKATIGERARAEVYVDRFLILTRVLGRTYIDAVAESELADCQTFAAKADRIEPTIRAALLTPNAAGWHDLHAHGWQGDISNAMVDFYMRQYEKHYPALDHVGHLEMLSRYLAQSWARYQLRIKTKYPQWERDFIQVNFPQPVPSAPFTLNRVFYRTVPTRYARTHIPPWRAKGFLCISDHDEITPKLATLHEPIANLTPFAVDLSNGRETVGVQADYIVREG